MPELIAEMNEDLLQPENKTVRHFFVLPNARVHLSTREHSQFTSKNNTMIYEARLRSWQTMDS